MSYKRPEHPTYRILPRPYKVVAEYYQDHPEKPGTFIRLPNKQFAVVANCDEVITHATITEPRVFLEKDCAGFRISLRKPARYERRLMDTLVQMEKEGRFGETWYRELPCLVDDEEYDCLQKIKKQ